MWKDPVRNKLNKIGDFSEFEKCLEDLKKTQNIDLVILMNLLYILYIQSYATQPCNIEASPLISWCTKFTPIVDSLALS